MGNRKHIPIFLAAAAVIIGAGFALFSGYTAVRSPEEQAIEEAFLAAEQTALEFAKFDSETGTTDSMTEEELNRCIDAYTEKVNRYYAADNPCREVDIANEAYLLRETFQTKTDYTIDCGILDCDFTKISVDSDQQRATVEATYTVWCKWVEQNDNGDFLIGAPINRHVGVATMVKEDGCWKLLDEDVRIEFGADIEAQAAEKPQAMKEAQEILDTKYATFAEACSAAGSIDENAVNPFAASGQTYESEA